MIRLHGGFARIVLGVFPDWLGEVDARDPAPAVDRGLPTCRARVGHGGGHRFKSSTVGSNTLLERVLPAEAWSVYGRLGPPSFAIVDDVTGGRNLLLLKVTDGRVR
jgi:hypothetical protein